MTDPQKIGDVMPELKLLALKLRDDLRAMTEMHIVRVLDHELLRMGKTQTAHRLAAALVLTSAGLGSMAQMLTVTMAAVLNRPVNNAQTLMYMLLNDGTTPLVEVMKRADELIALATERGFPMPERGEFDPTTAMREHIQGMIDSDPDVRSVVRKMAESDPTVAELLRKHGMDVAEKTKQ